MWLVLTKTIPRMAALQPTTEPDIYTTHRLLHVRSCRSTVCIPKTACGTNFTVRVNARLTASRLIAANRSLANKLTKV
jgi:hypothetical protein